MTESPARIMLRRARGWRMPADAVKVDRTTRWGNPFIVGKHGDQARCVELHRYLLAGYLCVSKDNIDAQRAHYEHVQKHIGELRGKALGCWCRAGQPCHADALLELANRADKAATQ